MRIAPVNYSYNNVASLSKKDKGVRPSNVSNPIPSTKEFTKNIFYMPQMQQNFTGLWLEKNIIRKVTGKQFQGLGLFKDGGSYIDFLKVGSEKLAKESLDITKATDNEVYAYWHANALSEAYESTWARRYNPNNVSKPLATYHTINSQKAKVTFAENLKELLNTSRNKVLDTPITDKKGNLTLDCVVFDTETTGLNIFNDSPKRLDKIVQVGALQVKGGKVVKESAYNQLINPGMPIPEGASKVHGITDEMVKNQKTMKFHLKGLLNDVLHPKNGVIVAYNSKFDMTILNNAIREHNVNAGTNIKQKEAFKVLDPFILIQRIHPYLGVRKKLGEQYKFLFAKNMENAHDAFADVEGTVDVLKYTLYKLSEHRKDKSVPLTMREVLTFQNGGKVENIDFPLDMEDCNAAVRYNKSYIQVPLCVDNYFKGYKITKNTLMELAPEIGPKNVKKLQGSKTVNHAVGLKTPSGLPINPAETKRMPNSSGFENSFYAMKKNIKKMLGFSKLEPYAGKSKDEIEDLIIEKSKQYIKEDTIDVWMKNTNPKDIKDGNDMADLAIARRVMSER